MKNSLFNRYEKFMNNAIKSVIDMDALMSMDPAQVGIVKEGLQLADDIVKEYVALFERTERMEDQLKRIEELLITKK